MHETLPAINALLNAVSTVLLISGYVAIRRRNRRRHATLMIAAFCTSALFLACYVWHKFALYEATGSINVSTEGFEPAWLRAVYLLVLLLPHLVLAMVMLPLIAVTFWFAWRRNWTWHTRFSRPTLWIWLYVSITGILIYLVLYHVILPALA